MTKLNDAVNSIKGLQVQQADIATRLAKLESSQPASGDVAGEITALTSQNTELQKQIDAITNLEEYTAPVAGGTTTQNPVSQPVDAPNPPAG